MVDPRSAICLVSDHYRMTFVIISFPFTSVAIRLPVTYSGQLYITFWSLFFLYGQLFNLSIFLSVTTLWFSCNLFVWLCGVIYSFHSFNLCFVPSLIKHFCHRPWRVCPYVPHLFVWSLAWQTFSIRLDVIVLSFYACSFVLLTPLVFLPVPCHSWRPLFFWTLPFSSFLLLLTILLLVSQSRIRLHSLQIGHAQPSWFPLPSSSP